LAPDLDPFFSLKKGGYLDWLAAGDKGAGQVEEGLAAVTEALRLMDK